MSRLAPAAALLLALAPALAFAAPAPQDAQVDIKNFAFSPDPVSVLVGETITWDNQDSVTHTVTADDGSFDSGPLGSGRTFSHTFSTVGTFPYHCNIHASMHGKVFVSQAGALPDLVIARIDARDNVTGVSQSVNVTVRNLGLAPAGASVTGLAFLYQGQAVTIANLTTPEVGPLASVKVHLDWLVLGKVGDFTLQATADAAGQVAEANEGNNVATAQDSIAVGGVPGIDLLYPLM